MNIHWKSTHALPTQLKHCQSVSNATPTQTWVLTARSRYYRYRPATNYPVLTKKQLVCLHKGYPATISKSIPSSAAAPANFYSKWAVSQPKSVSKNSTSGTHLETKTIATMCHCGSYCTRPVMYNQACQHVHMHFIWSGRCSVNVDIASFLCVSMQWVLFRADAHWLYACTTWSTHKHMYRCPWAIYQVDRHLSAGQYF